ncbi:MAG: YhbY family RNA-binding protein [Oscillospiraceae bacterium]|jgi:RNA-binding protein|nr:YhbY family RNA-binding protein [Oscillospiraceae bacterium]
MTSKERAALRAQANRLEAVFQVGKEGVTEAVAAQLLDAFRTRELLKGKVLLESAPQPPRECAAALAALTQAEVVQVVGGSMVFFKENLELRKELAKKAKGVKGAKKPSKKVRLAASAARAAKSAARTARNTEETATTTVKKPATRPGQAATRPGQTKKASTARPGQAAKKPGRAPAAKRMALHTQRRENRKG